jgi:hypothetical protein
MPKKPAKKAKRAAVVYRCRIFKRTPPVARGIYPYLVAYDTLEHPLDLTDENLESEACQTMTSTSLRLLREAVIRVRAKMALPPNSYAAKFNDDFTTEVLRKFLKIRRPSPART